MGSTAWLVLPGVLVFASASFFFALAESALFALGKWRARQVADQPGGASVLRLLEQPSALLATIVLGNTVANGALVSLALWPVLIGRWSLLPTLAGIALFILVGCEVLPKTLAVRAPEQWARRVAPPMILLREATGWLQRIFHRFNEGLLHLLARAFRPQTSPADAEYRELLELAFHQGTLARSEKEIILQIVSLDRKTARDVMKPRSQMAAICDDLSIEEMIEAARRFRHSRLPIYDETVDTIVGVLDTRSLLLNPDMDLADAIEFPSFVPESMNLLQLLKSLQRQQRRLAIVLDEFGGTAGLVTLDDILEEVVGQISRESDPTGFFVERLDEYRWSVSATMRLDDLRREYPELGEVPEVDTVGGLLISLLGVVPVAGESIVFRGLRLTARAVEDRRVRQVLVEVLKRK